MIIYVLTTKGIVLLFRHCTKLLTPTTAKCASARNEEAVKESKRMAGGATDVCSWVRSTGGRDGRQWLSD